MSNLLNNTMNMPRTFGAGSGSLLQNAAEKLPQLALMAGAASAGGGPLAALLTHQLFSGGLANTLLNGHHASSQHNNLAESLGNALLSGLNQHSASPYFTPASPGGASMGGTLVQHNLMDMLRNILSGMGITPQNSPFTPNANPGHIDSFTHGLNSGFSAPANMNNSFPTLTFPLSSNNAFNQMGNTLGSQINSQVTLQALNDVIPGNKLTPGGDGKVTGGSDDTRAAMGKFMDQHPEVFGKPQVDMLDKLMGHTSWESALKDSVPLSKDSLVQVQSAKNDLKTALAGGNIAANHPNMSLSGPMMNADAQLFNQQISQHAMQHAHHHFRIL